MAPWLPHGICVAACSVLSCIQRYTKSIHHLTHLCLRGSRVRSQRNHLIELEERTLGMAERMGLSPMRSKNKRIQRPSAQETQFAIHASVHYTIQGSQLSPFPNCEAEPLRSNEIERQGKGVPLFQRRRTSGSTSSSKKMLAKYVISLPGRRPSALSGCSNGGEHT